MSDKSHKTPGKTKGNTTPPKIITTQKKSGTMVPTNRKEAGRTSPPKVAPRNVGPSNKKK